MGWHPGRLMPGIKTNGDNYRQIDSALMQRVAWKGAGSSAIDAGAWRLFWPFQSFIRPRSSVFGYR